MSMPFERLVAAILSLVVGGLAAVSAFALVVANAVIGRGLGPVSAADVATLAAVMPLVPIVAGFGLSLAVGGAGLLAGAGWARSLVAFTSGIAVVVGVAALVALAFGYDPFVVAGHGRTSDGIGIVATGVVLNVAILAAVIADRGSEVTVGSSAA